MSDNKNLSDFMSQKLQQFRETNEQRRLKMAFTFPSIVSLAIYKVHPERSTEFFDGGICEVFRPRVPSEECSMYLEFTLPPDGTTRKVTINENIDFLPSGVIGPHCSWRIIEHRNIENIQTMVAYYEIKFCREDHEAVQEIHNKVQLAIRDPAVITNQPPLSASSSLDDISQ